MEGRCKALQLDFRAYFGGGVVVPPELFLLFLPPLWPFLVFVAFLPLAVLGALVSVLPPVACPNARVAPSNMVITSVNSLFMRSPSKESFSRFITDEPAP